MLRIQTLLVLQLVLSLFVLLACPVVGAAEVSGEGHAVDYTRYLPSNHKPVLHFLLISWGEIPNQDIWSAFFKDVPEDRYRIWIHAKDQEKLLSRPITFKYTLVDDHFNAYIRLARVMNWLLDNALSASHSSNDMFIFLSDDSLPVKPFHALYHRLAVRHTMSLFCIAPTNQWLDLGSGIYIPKAHQWMVLNKADSIASVKQWKLHTNLPELVVALDNSQTTTGLPQLDPPTAWEEFWFGPSIFGLHNLSAPYNVFDYPSESEQGMCPMYVWWPDSDPQSQFRRDIPELTEANTQGNQRLWEVPLDFIKAMRKSSFLFARKWNDLGGYDKVGDPNMTLTEAFVKHVFVSLTD
jgi:hypothetical protein